MQDMKECKIGDILYWVDLETGVFEVTFLGMADDIAILVGETTQIQKNKEFPAPTYPLVDKNIKEKIKKLADINEPYHPYPVYFAEPKYLFVDRMEARMFAMEKFLEQSQEE